MQREKLHNLHRTAYFIVAFIYFENRQNSERSNFDVAKKVVFWYATNALLCYLSPDMFYLKKTKYTTRCSLKNSTIRKEQFILCMQLLFLKTSKILSTQLSTLQKFYTNEDFLFSYFIFLSIIMLS